MSKPFDYSKWDNIELSDDESDCHPNIDKESWFRMKHRSRVEREEAEAKDKEKINKEMTEAKQRIQTLENDLKKISKLKGDDSDSDDDDDLDDTEGIKAEIQQKQELLKKHQAKLDEYEKNKKWNIDNMFEVKEERTVVNTKKLSYTEAGYAAPKDGDLKSMTTSMAGTKIIEKEKASTDISTTTTTKTSDSNSSSAADAKKGKVTAAAPVAEPLDTVTADLPPTKEVSGPEQEVGSFDTYHSFTEKYADRVEEFMAIQDLSGSRDFLLQHGAILLQENASNYLLLASLEDEMNGEHEKMKRTARQSQLISSIAELAKTVKSHPGNVVMPFFQRLEERTHLEEFLAQTKIFQDRIVERAKVKRAAIDAERAAEERSAQNEEGTSLQEVPREQRLGPGGLDPLEVIETLPESLVKAFESRDVEELKKALMELPPADAEKHMKDCVDSGLWVQ